MYRGSEPSCSRLYEMYGGIAACQAAAFPFEPVRCSPVAFSNPIRGFSFSGKGGGV